ncbi:MAG: hypothetical protein GY950_18720 [bacterium]|nr:hypothetical protein [bacterium]
MKKIMLSVMVLLCALYCFPQKGGVLTELNRPGMMLVSNDELYVIEDATIFVYSIDDCRLKRKFGKMGEGPGELKVQPNWLNGITVSSDTVYAESVDKIVEFSKDGNVKKERKKPVESAKFTPVGINFVGKKIKRDLINRVVLVTIVLYNPDMEEIKELYRQKFPQQPAQRGFKIELFSDLLGFQVADDKIFIEESPKGFVIEDFSSTGQKLYQIEKKYEKINVTIAKKNAALEEVKQDPTIKRRLKQFGSWENLTKVMQFTFPGYMPPIRQIDISGKKIYVQTYKVVDNKVEYIVMDLKGKILGKLYLPELPNPGLKGQVLGVKLYTIKNNKLYYLKEDPDEEHWALHIKKINY